MKTKLVSIRGTDSAMQITFRDEPSGLWDKVTRRKPKEWTVRGAAAIWFHYPSGDRCDQELEIKLFNIWMNRENLGIG